MSLRTCPYCGNKYEDNWSSWHNKFCCSNCYKSSKTKFILNDEVYTNKDIKRNGLLNAELAKGKIINIYKINGVTKNGLYQYAIRFNDNSRTSYRFEHQIFKNEKDGEKYVNYTNEKRKIDRQAKELKKKLLGDY